MLYLVDSDWAIDHLNDIQSAVQRLARFLPLGVGISIVSLAEIYEGMYGSPSFEQEESLLSEFLESIEVLYITDAICRIFAQERRRLRSMGALIGDLDLLIAATAIGNNLTLLTNNRRHFERVQGLNLISV